MSIVRTRGTSTSSGSLSSISSIHEMSSSSGNGSRSHSQSLTPARLTRRQIASVGPTQQSSTEAKALSEAEPLTAAEISPLANRTPQSTQDSDISGNTPILPALAVYVLPTSTVTLDSGLVPKTSGSQPLSSSGASISASSTTVVNSNLSATSGTLSSTGGAERRGRGTRRSTSTPASIFGTLDAEPQQYSIANGSATGNEDNVVSPSTKSSDDSSDSEGSFPLWLEDPTLPSEAHCSVCGSNSRDCRSMANTMVQCASCKVCVHRGCYGVRFPNVSLTNTSRQAVLQASGQTSGSQDGARSSRGASASIIAQLQSLIQSPNSSTSPSGDCIPAMVQSTLSKLNVTHAIPGIHSPWKCAPCSYGLQPHRIQCAVCPLHGGALKPCVSAHSNAASHGSPSANTNLMKWAHVTCVAWLPELGFEDPSMLSPVVGVDDVAAFRRKLSCSICLRNKGACLTCSAPDCRVAFHPLCAQQSNFRMEIVTLQSDIGVPLSAPAEKDSFSAEGQTGLLTRHQQQQQAARIQHLSQIPALVSACDEVVPLVFCPRHGTSVLDRCALETRLRIAQNVDLSSQSRRPSNTGNSPLQSSNSSSFLWNEPTTWDPEAPPPIVLPSNQQAHGKSQRSPSPLTIGGSGIWQVPPASSSPTSASARSGTFGGQANVSHRSGSRRFVGDQADSMQLSQSPTQSPKLSDHSSTSFHTASGVSGRNLETVNAPVLISPEGLWFSNLPVAQDSTLLYPDSAPDNIKAPRTLAKVLCYCTERAKEAAAVKLLRLAEESDSDGGHQKDKEKEKEKEKEKTREKWLRAEVDGEIEPMAVRALTDTTGRRVFKVSPVSGALELVLLMQSIKDVPSLDLAFPSTPAVILSGAVHILPGADTLNQLQYDSASNVSFGSEITLRSDRSFSSHSKSSKSSMGFEDEMLSQKASGRKGGSQVFSASAAATAAANAAAAAAEKEVVARARMAQAKAEAENEAHITASLNIAGIDISKISASDRKCLLSQPNVMKYIGQLSSSTGARGWDSDGEGAEDAPDSDFEDPKGLLRVMDLYFRPLDAQDMLRIGRFLPAATAEMQKQQRSMNDDNAIEMTSKMYDEWLAMESYSTTSAGVDPSFVIPPLGHPALRESDENAVKNDDIIELQTQAVLAEAPKREKNLSNVGLTPYVPSSFSHRNITMLMGLSRRRHRQFVDPLRVDDWTLDQLITSAELGSESTVSGSETGSNVSSTVQVGTKRKRTCRFNRPIETVRLTLEIHRHWLNEGKDGEAARQNPQPSSKGRRGASARSSEATSKRVKISKAEGAFKSPTEFSEGPQSSVFVEIEVSAIDVEEAIELAKKEREEATPHGTSTRISVSSSPSPKQQVSRNQSSSTSRPSSPARTRLATASTPFTETKAVPPSSGPGLGLVLDQESIEESEPLMKKARSQVRSVPEYSEKAMKVAQRSPEAREKRNAAVNNNAEDVGDHALALSADVVPYSNTSGDPRSSPLILSQLRDEVVFSSEERAYEESVAEGDGKKSGFDNGDHNSNSIVSQMSDATPRADSTDKDKEVDPTKATSTGTLPVSEGVAALAGVVAFRSCPTPRHAPVQSPSPQKATSAHASGSAGRGRTSRRLIREDPPQPPASQLKSELEAIESQMNVDVSNSVLLAQALPTHGIRIAFNASAGISSAHSNAVNNELASDSQLAQRVTEILLERGVQIFRASPLAGTFMGQSEEDLLSSERLKISDLNDSDLDLNEMNKRATAYLLKEAPLQTMDDIASLVHATNQTIEEKSDTKSKSLSDKQRLYDSSALRISEAEAWGPLYVRTLHARENHRAWLDTRQTVLLEKKQSARQIAYRRARADLCAKLQEAVADKRQHQKQFNNLLQAAAEAEAAADYDADNEISSDEHSGDEEIDYNQELSRTLPKWKVRRMEEDDFQLSLTELSLQVFPDDFAESNSFSGGNLSPNSKHRKFIIEAAVDGDEVLALLLHAQQRLSRQVALNSQRREKLRSQVRLRHAVPPIRIRQTWMQGVVAKCLYIGAWQTLRYAFAKGIADVPVPLYIAHEISLKLKRAHAISTLRKLQHKNQIYSSRLASLESQLSQVQSSTNVVDKVTDQIEDAIEQTITVLKSCQGEITTTLTLIAALGEECSKALSNAPTPAIRLTKPGQKDSRDFSACGVCLSLESTETNPLIICEVCALAVHKVCYGLTKVPDNDWMCQYCRAQRPSQAGVCNSSANGANGHHHSNGATGIKTNKSAKGTKQSNKHAHSDANLPSHPGVVCATTPQMEESTAHVKSNEKLKGCQYCPVSGGCLKPAEHGGWAHIFCAFWIPGLRIGDVAAMEPICGDSAALSYFAQSKVKHGSSSCICGVCCRDVGITTKCAEANCNAHFHPLCSWYAGLYMRAYVDGLNCHFRLYCPAHTPLPALSSETPFTGHLPDPLPLSTLSSKESVPLSEAEKTVRTQPSKDSQQQKENNPNAILRPRPPPIDPARAAAIPPCPSTGAASVDYARLFALLYPSRATSRVTCGVTTRGMLFPAVYAMMKIGSERNNGMSDISPTLSGQSLMPDLEGDNVIKLVEEGKALWLRFHPESSSIRASEIASSALASIGISFESVTERHLPIAADAEKIYKLTLEFPVHSMSITLHRALVEFRLMTQQAMRRRGRIDPASSARRSRKLSRSAERHAKLQLARLQKEDTYDPNRCAICFCDESDSYLEKEARIRRIKDMDEVYLRQLYAYRQAYEQQQAVVAGIRRKYIAIGTELLKKQIDDAQNELGRCKEKMDQIVEKAAESIRSRLQSDQSSNGSNSKIGSTAITGAAAAAVAAAKNTASYKELKARCTELEESVSSNSSGGQSNMNLSSLPSVLRRKYLEEVARLGPPLQPLVHPSAAGMTSSSQLRLSPAPSVQYSAAMERRAKLYGQDLLLRCAQCNVSVHQSCAGVTQADLELTAQLVLSSNDGGSLPASPFGDGVNDSPTSTSDNMDARGTKRQIPFILPGLIPILDKASTAGSNASEGHGNVDVSHDSENPDLMFDEDGMPSDGGMMRSHSHTASSTHHHIGQEATSQPINTGPGSFVHLLSESPSAASILLSAWRCRRCTNGEGARELSCAICPRRGGAFTRIHAGQSLQGTLQGQIEDDPYSSFSASASTSSLVSPVAQASLSSQLSTSATATGFGRWIHVACAMWHPECIMRDAAHMDQVDGLRFIPRSRRTLRCSFCQRPGPCITCSFPGCNVAFHPLCAQFARCRLSIAPELPTMGGVSRIALCRAHTPLHLIRGALIPAGHEELARSRNILGSAVTIMEAQRRMAIAQKAAVHAAVDRVEGLLKSVLLPFVPAGTDVLSRDVYASKLKKYYVEQVEHTKQLQIHIQQQIQHQIQVQHHMRQSQKQQSTDQVKSENVDSEVGMTVPILATDDSQTIPPAPQPPIPPPVPSPPYLLTQPSLVLAPEALNSGIGSSAEGLSRVLPRHLQWPEEALALFDPETLSRFALAAVDVIGLCNERLKQEKKNAIRQQEVLASQQKASCEAATMGVITNHLSSSTEVNGSAEPVYTTNSLPGLYLDDVAAKAGIDVSTITNPALLVLARALAAFRRDVSQDPCEKVNVKKEVVEEDPTLATVKSEQEANVPHQLDQVPKKNKAIGGGDVVYADLYSSWASYPESDVAIQERVRQFSQSDRPIVQTSPYPQVRSELARSVQSKAYELETSLLTRENNNSESEIKIEPIQDPRPATGLGFAWQDTLAPSALVPDVIPSSDIPDSLVSRDAVEFELAVRMPTIGSSSHIVQMSVVGSDDLRMFENHPSADSAKFNVKASKTTVRTPQSPFSPKNALKKALAPEISLDTPVKVVKEIIGSSESLGSQGNLSQNDEASSMDVSETVQMSKRSRLSKQEGKDDVALTMSASISQVINKDIAVKENKSSHDNLSDSTSTAIGSKRKVRSGRSSSLKNSDEDSKSRPIPTLITKKKIQEVNVDAGPTQTVGAVIRVKRGGVSVEATVLDIDKRTKAVGNSPPITSFYYLLHYTGMNKKLDDWVSEAQLKRILISASK